MQCGEWNTLLEVVPELKGRSERGAATRAVCLNAVEVKTDEVIPTGFSEVDSVLGTGLVRGSVLLFGGEPGIGKSTLSLQIAQQMAGLSKQVLYISAEESSRQVALRSRRLGQNSDQLWVLFQTDMAAILSELEKLKPELVILDSIQMVNHASLGAGSGSVSQVKYCADAFISWVKQRNTIGIIIGHITKDGHLAGPKVLEHMVDVILYLEGERNQRYRILRSYKNRYAPSDEIGVFDMQKNGLVSVSDVSDIFIDQSTLSNPGTTVSAISEGSRIFLVEVQALVVQSGFGMAKRSFVGVNNHRATLMIATMEKVLGKKLFSKDVFLNIIGGLRVDEPALDVAIVMAIFSSLEDQPVLKRIGFIGEVGLTGELRPVTNVVKRVKEFKKMGFDACFLPQKNKKSLKSMQGIDLFFVQDIQSLVLLYKNTFLSETYDAPETQHHHPAA